MTIETTSDPSVVVAIPDRKGGSRQAERGYEVKVRSQGVRANDARKSKLCVPNSDKFRLRAQQKFYTATKSDTNRKKNNMSTHRSDQDNSRAGTMGSAVKGNFDDT